MLRALWQRVAGLLGLRRGRPELPEDAFVTLRDEDGRAVGMMDRMTQDFLESTASSPSQASLDEAFTGVVRVRVVDWGKTRDNRLARTRILADIVDAASIDRLRDCLRIDEDPRLLGHCMCIGEEALELYTAGGLVATFSLHHGQRIRWDAWKYDGELQDGRPLLTFLAERGIPDPLARYERDARRADESLLAAERWRNAMPACLAPFWNDMQGLDADTTAMREALARAWPDAGARGLKLFEWLGCSDGPWSGIPLYEMVPERLLLAESTADLVAALNGAGPLSRARLEGAARYFAGWEFWHRKEADAALIPAALRRRLLDHVRPSPDGDKVERAHRAFSGA